jgi:hypothetical protein
MYKIDNTKYCDIFHNSFYQDLEKHSLVDDENGDVFVQYDTVAQKKPVSIKMEAVTGLIDSSVEEEVWTPALISDENLITHKPFFGKQQIKNTILGAEDAVTFESRFKNWDTEEASNSGFKSINMSCNWFISSMLTTIKPEYGVLFWYKKNSSYSTSGTLPYKDIPVGTIVSWTGSYSYKGMTLSSGNYGVKVNSSTISLLNKKSALIQNSTDINATGLNISFNSEIQTVNLEAITDTDHFYVLNKGISYTPAQSDDPDAPTVSASFYDLWIPDGECFSYYETEVGSLRGRANQENSNTYLSPGLFSIYREIYHRLTLRRVKGIATALNKKKSLALQKLCYFLSSSPLIDRTTIDLLNDQSIYDAVNTYLDLNITSTDNEKTELKNILNIIFSKYKSLSKSTFKKHNRNHIQTKLDLVKKLISKYPPALSISSDAGLKFKKPLENGPHAFLSLSSFNMYDKTTPVASSIYNNSSIKIGNISYWTDISTTGSLINIKADNFSTTGNIPLADISLSPMFSDVFYLGSGIRKPFEDPETTIDADLINPSPGEDYSYFWERVSGPLCLRFGDYNKDIFRQQRFITSTDASPTVYLYAPGTYEIKATRSKPGGIVQSDILKITTSNTEPLNTDITRPISYSQSKVISGVFKQLAFNKRGLLWIIDSDNYYDNGSVVEGTDYNGYDGVFELKNIQLDFNINQQTITTLHSNADLKLSFFPNNTKILLLSMQMENMRDRNYQYCQCKSFFKEQVLLDRSKKLNADGDQLGGGDFYRKYLSSTKFVFQDHLTQRGTNESVTYGNPSVSTILSPTILPYGGYSKEIVDVIGIKMSGHPEPSVAEMPVLLSRNDLTSQTGTYCHLKEVMPTGSRHYVEFQRGHFHPLSGWINNTSSNFTDYVGKSSVISRNLDKQKSFVFSGPGIVNLRPSLDGQQIVYRSRISLASAQISLDFNNNRYGYDNINADATLNPNVKVDEYVGNEAACSLPTRYYTIPTGVSPPILILKDIEIKLNFLNYPNPKNMIVWLEVKNSTYDSSSLPSDEKFFISNDSSNYSSNAALSSYMSTLDSMNPIPTEGTAKLYLLNQEHISNYSSNFSIKFSDHANKYINTTTSNNGTYIGSNLQESLHDNGEILPSIVASGYNDIDVEMHKNIIRTNNINKINNSFSKFNKINLTDTTEFILNFAFIDSLDHPNNILDNLLTNDLLAGLSSTENKYYSTSASNSFCNWEIILHTDKIRQNVASDVLGYIDYAGTTIGSGYIPHSGVNFIGDFTNRNFLIPNVNINAPYAYLANINNCFYNNPNIPRTISSQPPTFPSLLSYAMLGATIGFAGLAGGLGALIAVSAALSTGGRGDPIVNYFINTRFADQTVRINAEYYKPVYTNEPFGNADTAIVCASNDGARWYYFETPIFRYINTPALQKNRYKFIKLAQNNIPALSHFNYKTITNYSDFKLSPITQVTVSNISSLSGTGVKSSDMPPFYKNDIVYVDSQTTITENGYYVVNTGSWEKIPDSLSSVFLQNNRSNTSSSIDLATKQNILVNGTRAFNFFDVSDTVYISPADKTTVVTAKYLLSTSEGNKTLFVLSSGIEENGYITKTSGLSDVLFLYKDDTTTRTPEGFPINNWAFSNRTNESMAPISPESHFSAYGEGSIGWGTDVRDPESLYTISPDYNKLLHTTDIINNNINDRLKLNQVTIIDSSNNISFINFTEDDSNYGLLRGWSYTNNDFGYIFENNDSVFSNDLTEDSLIKRLRSTSFADRSDPVLMDIKCSKFVGTGAPVSGSIILQNDFIKTSTVKFDTSSILTMKNRLNLLATDIIPSSINYYNGLQNDPASCLTSETYSITNCPKTEAKQALANYSREKNELEIALSLSSLTDITPYISGGIIQNTGTDLAPQESGIKVSYKENRDLYWIHIDPEKHCDLANEISAKILYKTEYDITAKAGSFVESSQVSPTFALPISNGIDENFNQSGGGKITYETSQSGIISEMNRLSALYPSISWSTTPPALWDKSQEYFYGSSSGGSKKLLVCLGDDTKDYIFSCKETYIRPAGTTNKAGGKIKDMLDLTSNTLKIKFRNLPRKIKGIDTAAFQAYTYDKNGNLIKSLTTPTDGGRGNNFVCWHCINPSGQFVNPSGFLVAQNEMIYRNFFGSIDGIENKNSQYMDTQEAWEWIPYEYYKDTTIIPIERTCACGSAQTGGAGTTTDTYTLPVEEGVMVLSYNSYGIKDRYVIDYDGQMEFDSGFVSGSGIHSFTKPDGIDEISVTVNGGDLNTIWTYTLSCPVAT